MENGSMRPSYLECSAESRAPFILLGEASYRPHGSTTSFITRSNLTRASSMYMWMNMAKCIKRIRLGFVMSAFHCVTSAGLTVLGTLPTRASTESPAAAPPRDRTCADQRLMSTNEGRVRRLIKDVWSTMSERADSPSLEGHTAAVRLNRKKRRSFE